MTWRFWIDRGGTFTDVVARAPDGALHTAKLLSQDSSYDDAAIEAVRRLAGGDPGPVEVRIGTTVATNALLERKGEPTLLAITRGFGDALVIGHGERADLFALDPSRPPPLHARVAEIDERVAANGTVLRPLDRDAARDAFQAGYDAGLRAVAIVLVHGYRYTAHEAALAKIACAVGFTQVSVSHEVAPLIKLIGRGDTTLVDAYLSPVVRRYADALTAALGEEALFMQSSGGLVSAAAFRGKDAVLSGPAGGIVGMAATARAAGFDRVIGFDMGGTSTDVSHYAGTFERDTETVVAGIRIRAPMLRIHTVAAGGGSICRHDGAVLAVGPESAGALPGPACYRRGGPLTITDCNVMLGKLRPEFFPALFGPAGHAPLDTAAVDARFAELALDPQAAAEGFVAVAVANMASAIRTISVARGHDVTRAVLACFGGAGGQHACLVADALGMERVMIHPLAGVLSAYGMGLADRRLLREETLGVAADDGAAIGAATARLADAARTALAAQGIAAGTIEIETRLELRRGATEHSIAVVPADAATMAAAFDREHRAQFGYASDAPLVVDRIVVEAVARSGVADAGTPPPETLAPPLATVPVYMAGRWRDAPVHARDGLPNGHVVAGPALIVDAVSTTVVEPGWRARVDPRGNLILDRAVPRAAIAGSAAADPTRLAIFAGLFMGIAEEMGAALRRSAMSVNIRERLDFSCAVFDARGNLVANAPHIPVHLGSMGDSIRAVLATRGDARDGRGLRPGDAYALNDPYRGGTHLPDITVIAPVFAAEGEVAPAWFVAARGHHADVGGTAPGSMPAESRSVATEGVLLDDVLLVDAGRFREAELRAMLASGPYPARNIDQNIADLAAQLAACARGAAGLRRAAAESGAEVVGAYMEHLQRHAADAVRRRIASLADGTFAYAMDDGAVIRVAIRVDRTAGEMTVDFSGTSDQRPNNFNAPTAIVRAAVLYVLRTLIGGDVPLNDGCLRPVTIVVPEGSMLAPRFPAAVVAGNVETSQAITDALFGALGVVAASQGTMNNFTFGDDAYQYYETIAGGAGAGAAFDGESAIQTHMTNSRLTDPEVLETRFPVLLEEFSVRRGSGGAGAHRGGDGAIRRVRFLADMTACILANRRRVPPFGTAGGAPGAVGAARVERRDGSVEPLASTARVDVRAGDVFVIETPGGGGFGEP